MQEELEEYKVLDVYHREWCCGLLSEEVELSLSCTLPDIHQEGKWEVRESAVRFYLVGYFVGKRGSIKYWDDDEVTSTQSRLQSVFIDSR